VESEPQDVNERLRLLEERVASLEGFHDSLLTAAASDLAAGDADPEKGFAARVLARVGRG
jgi:hypothetical protein